ncbi:hypothetical protein SFUMM280S_02667 [Streptomyces fumanus]
MRRSNPMAVIASVTSTALASSLADSSPGRTLKEASIRQVSR